MTSETQFKRLLLAGTTRRRFLGTTGAVFASTALARQATASMLVPLPQPASTSPLRATTVTPAPVINLAALGPLPLDDLAKFQIAVQEMVLTAQPVVNRAFLPPLALAAIQSTGFTTAFSTVLTEPPADSSATSGNRTFAMYSAVGMSADFDWTTTIATGSPDSAEVVDYGDGGTSWTFDDAVFYGTNQTAPSRALFFARGPFVLLLVVSDLTNKVPSAHQLQKVAAPSLAMLESALGGIMTASLAAIMPAASFDGQIAQTFQSQLIAVDGQLLPATLAYDPSLYKAILDQKGTIMAGSYSFTDPYFGNLLTLALLPDRAKQVQYFTTSASVGTELYVFPPDADVSGIPAAIDNLLTATFDDWQITPGSGG